MFDVMWSRTEDRWVVVPSRLRWVGDTSFGVAINLSEVEAHLTLIEANDSLYRIEAGNMTDDGRSLDPIVDSNVAYDDRHDVARFLSRDYGYANMMMVSHPDGLRGEHVVARFEGGQQTFPILNSSR